jgi:hypothetical protein
VFPIELPAAAGEADRRRRMRSAAFTIAFPPVEALLVLMFGDDPPVRADRAELSGLVVAGPAMAAAVSASASRRRPPRHGGMTLARAREGSLSHPFALPIEFR